ncbi:MAG: site-specific DNA-methyltransferase [Candidatus Helarchaeota archaeon]|nr:site-specific DNA-methyltransferase [Candidatus Helarchaeota archaeon]
MVQTSHKIYFKNSQNMKEVEDESVDLTLTSPPYPLIEMWDQQFAQLNPEIKNLLVEGKGRRTFERMHQELDKTWNEIFRVLKDGGIACINIGDTTRKMGGQFQQFSNHARVLGYCTNQLDFSMLPSILWRKQSNKPNKFMGSGMLPSNAYVTLEHENILILRKGSNRIFNADGKKRRYQSAYFWEERNTWFSDIWFDLKGIDQKLIDNNVRIRSAAFPFELAYRLVNMYSIQGDIVLDPFLGIGTTLLAAMASNRNSIGYEIERGFKEVIHKRLQHITSFANKYLRDRLEKHREFVKKMEGKGKPLKYYSEKYDFKVVTSQETEIFLPFLKEINSIADGKYEIVYE